MFLYSTGRSFSLCGALDWVACRVAGRAAPTRARARQPHYEAEQDCRATSVVESPASKHKPSTYTFRVFTQLHTTHNTQAETSQTQHAARSSSKQRSSSLIAADRRRTPIATMGDREPLRDASASYLRKVGSVASTFYNDENNSGAEGAVASSSSSSGFAELSQAFNQRITELQQLMCLRIEGE